MVHHHPNVCSVDPHPKGVGGHHDRSGRLSEPSLHLLAEGRKEPGMVSVDLHSTPDEAVPDPLHFPSGGCIDEPSAGATLDQGPKEGNSCRPARNQSHAPAQVWAVETLQDPDGIPEAEALHDLFPDPGCGGGGEGHEGRGDPCPDSTNLQVGWSEIMPPKRDAVGLVHGDHAYREMKEEILKSGGLQSLRRDEEKAQFPSPSLLQHSLPTLGGKG